MISRRRREGGFTIICMLMALVIIGILTQNYFSTDTPDGQIWVKSRIDRAREVAVMANLRTVQQQYAIWLMDAGRPTTQEIANRLAGLSDSMGGGGRFFVDSSGNVLVTTQLETPTFAERLQLPRER